MLITNKPTYHVPRTTYQSSLVIASLSVVLVTIIAGWIWNGGGITVFEVFVWRPLAFLTILMGASFWWSKRNKISLAQSLDDLLAFVPYALIFTVLLGFIPIWKLDYASLPMSLGDIGLYFVSLGIAPRLAGPDILFRGFVWGIALLAAIKTYRTHKDIGTSLLDLLLIWVTASIALLLPWFVFWIIGTINGAGLAGGQEMMRVFSQTALNGYWSNLQIVRWFLGFGEQLSHSMALLLSSFFFIIVTLYSVTVFKDKIFFLIKKISWENAALLALALATGLVAGWSRASWAWMDCVVWIVLAITVSSSVLMHLTWFESEDKIKTYFFVVALVGSFLLGWPVLVAFFALACVIALGTGIRLQTYGSALFNVLLFMAISILTIAFMRKGDFINTSMLLNAASILVLCLPALLPKQMDWLKRAIVWFVSGILATLLLKSLIPVAIALLAVAVWHAIQKFKPSLLLYLSHTIYVCALVVLILAIWLPRLINPRLLPY